jgi:translocation and assembly module TamB
MPRRIAIIAALITAFVLAVPTGAIYFAAYTQTGLRFIVARLPGRIGSVRLRFFDVGGTLVDGVRIGRLEIDQERVYLRLEDVRVRIELRSLLWQSIHSPRAFVHHAYIRIKPHPEEPPSSDPHFLPRGLVIRADALHADAVSVVLASGRRIESTQIDTAGYVRRHTIRILDSTLAWQGMQLWGETELTAGNPLAISGNVRATLRPSGEPPWIFTVNVRGDLERMPLSVALTAPFRADFLGEARQLTAHWNWSGNAKVAEFDLRTWGGSGALGVMRADLAVSGDATGYIAHGTVTPAGLNAGAFDAIFEGSYAERVLKARRIELTHQASGAHLEGAGNITLVEHGPRLALSGSWRDFRWPLSGDAGIRSATGNYTISGIWPYDLSGNGVVTVRNFVDVPLKIDAQLAKDRLTVRSADAHVLDGEASFAGELAWAPAQSWSAAGSAVGIDPGRLRADLPGELNFAFNAAGAGFRSDDDFSVELKGIAGRLRGLAAHGGGTIARRRKAWEFSAVRLALGQTMLALDGTLGEKLALKFAIDATDMSVLAADSRGELHAHGTLGGTRSVPALTLSAHGKGIRHDGMTLESIDAEAAFDMGAAAPTKLDLHARNFTFRARKLNALDLAVNGTTASHELRLDAKAPGLSVNLHASGGMARDAWQGYVTALNVEGSESLHLALEAPVAFLASAQHVHTNKLCVQGQPGRMCLDADWTPAHWTGGVEAHDLPMSTLTAGLAPSIEYHGHLSVTASASGGGGQPLQGTLRADLGDARLSHRTAAGKVELIQLGTGVVTVNAGRTAIAGEVSFDAGPVGTIKAHVSAARTTSQWENMPLEGALQAHTAELGYVTLYFPEIDRAAGELDVNLAIRGTLGTPLLAGSIKLSNTELDFFQVNLALRHTELEAKLHDNALDFSGSAHIGQGTLSARGALAWRDSLPYGQFHMEGTDLRIADIPEAQIDASPTLDFTIKGRQIAVVGNVKVPYAKIVPADLTGAVRTSSDEVLVGKAPPDPNERFEVTSDVTLVLGDKVSIDTAGLKGRLTGSIAVHSGADNVTTGTGELSVEDGKYSAYGRQLDIQRGRLIFNGGVIEDPGIDIRAVKVFPDVTAGVNVRGTLRQPRISYFSDPSLTQSQILSLLLAGGSLESVQNRNNSAASQLIAQGGAMLAQQFGSKVGIQDVGLESDLSNETSLVLGRYLSPRLYISYGVSLTQSLNTVKLRYTLSDHWTIKTEAGQARGADLVFTIQK